MLVSLANIDYYYLNIIALTNICIGLCISFFLPMPKKTLFFYTEQKPSINVEQGLIESTNAEPEKGSADDEDDDELGQVSAKFKFFFMVVDQIFCVSFTDVCSYHNELYVTESKTK